MSQSLLVFPVVVAVMYPFSVISFAAQVLNSFAVTLPAGPRSVSQIASRERCLPVASCLSLFAARFCHCSAVAMSLCAIPDRSVVYVA